jgi:hypothetical protein
MCLSHLIYTVRPCQILAIPRPCHALTMPFFSRPRHSTVVEKRPVGYLEVFGFFRLPRGVPRRLLSEAYLSSSQRSIPTTAKSGSNTLQKDDLLNIWTSSSGISCYHADFHEEYGTSGAGQGRGMAGEWHGHGMLCVNPPLMYRLPYIIHAYCKAVWQSTKPQQVNVQALFCLKPREIWVLLKRSSLFSLSLFIPKCCPCNTKTYRLLLFRDISQNTYRPIHCLAKYTI